MRYEDYLPWAYPKALELSRLLKNIYSSKV